MKTAISIPDPLFKAADQYAKRHGFSRSQLFARAVALYLKQHPSDHITNQLNEVYAKEDSHMDVEMVNLQHRSIEKEEW